MKDENRTHLLITSAVDVTSDLICERLSGAVLRVNWERWNEYSVDICRTRFRIADRFGREVTEATIGNIIWRKPVSTINPELGELWYCFHEFKCAVQSIMEWVRQQNSRKLPIDPTYYPGKEDNQLNDFSRILGTGVLKITLYPLTPMQQGAQEALHLRT